MSQQPNRLPPGSGVLSGDAIDRGRPVRFRLNGRVVSGYSGDTVLSAALASGIGTIGTLDGEPLALDERFAPPIVAAGERAALDSALPMDRTPALDGIDLLTMGARRPDVPHRSLLETVRHLLYGPRRGLRHRLDARGALDFSWLSAAPVETIDTDLVVVGAGVAGLSAAIAAARTGERVVLIEKRQATGGDAGFFGNAEGEESLLELLPRLAHEMAGLDGIRLMLRAHAFAASGTRVLAHVVEVNQGRAAGRVVEVAARRIVLATGTVERLPVFPGNRSPGVTLALAAWRRAARYGIWLGRKATFSTSVSQPYRLAILASDAGVHVQRVNDARPRPQSRFIDFAKASAIPLAFAMVPTAARPAGQGLAGLYASFAVSLEEGERIEEPAWTEQLVVSGGWQPDLVLWLMAGGRCRWSDSARLEPDGTVPGVALAGAAAGLRGLNACVASGVAAVDALLGRPVAPIEDFRIDPMFETPDGPVPVRPLTRRLAGTSFLDAGDSLARLLGERGLAGLGPQHADRPGSPASFADQDRALSPADVAAIIQIGAAPASEAGAIAAERCIAPISHAAPVPDGPVAPAAATPYPPWLVGRFGPHAKIWHITADEPRAFEPGALIYLNSDPADPTAAVGVVLSHAPPGARGAPALIGKSPAAPGDRLVLHDIGGMVRVRLLRPPRERAPADADASIAEGAPPPPPEQETAP